MKGSIKYLWVQGKGFRDINQVSNAKEVSGKFWVSEGFRDINRAPNAKEVSSTEIFGSARGSEISTNLLKRSPAKTILGKRDTLGSARALRDALVFHP